MNPTLSLVAAQQGGVFSRRQALESGFSPDQIARCLAEGRWERIRRGQYAESVDPSALTPWEREPWEHRRRLHAVMNSLRSGSVAVSHQSALVLHDLPLWGLDLGRVHVNRLDGQSGGVIAGVQHHLGKLTDADLMEIEGRLVTTVPRAILESACTTSFEVAVVIIDAALREYHLGDEVIRNLLQMSEFWPGGPTARAALRFANGLSESVGESRVRVFLRQHGLPAPLLQVEFHDADGFIGRVDFYFPEYDTVVEFDGHLKYDGATSGVLVREKRREDRLRALGLHVVRTDWSDLNRPAHLVASIRQAFTRHHRAA